MEWSVRVTRSLLSPPPDPYARPAVRSVSQPKHLARLNPEQLRAAETGEYTQQLERSAMASLLDLQDALKREQRRRKKQQQQGGDKARKTLADVAENLQDAIAPFVVVDGGEDS